MIVQSCARESLDWILGTISTLERVVKLWHRLLRAVVKSLSLGAFKSHVGVALGDMD